MASEETHLQRLEFGDIDVKALKKRYDIIQQIKKEVLTKDDFVKLKNGELATRKSGWLKYAVAFALSFNVLSERKDIDPENPKMYSYHITVQCWDPTKTRHTEAVGTCTFLEKSTFTTEHIVRAMADTRATERAIIKMLGTNEKAADDLPAEMLKEDDPTIEGNFCKDPSHKHTVEEEKVNRCVKSGKMIRMP